MPVAVTIARPRPWVTTVPLKTLFTRSARAACRPTAAGSFSTGSLSPVNDASDTLSAAAVSSRPSAPTASPSARTMTSPTTISLLGIRLCSPSRTTAAVAAVIRARASTALSALACWA